MKRPVFFPVLLVIFSVITVAVYRSPYAYFNLFLSVLIFCIVLFSKRKDAVNRIKYSAMWFLLLELLAFVLLFFGENVYQQPTVWSMYVLIALLDIFVTPQIVDKR